MLQRGHLAKFAPNFQRGWFMDVPCVYNVEKVYKNFNCGTIIKINDLCQHDIFFVIYSSAERVEHFFCIFNKDDRCEDMTVIKPWLIFLFSNVFSRTLCTETKI